MAHLYRQSFSQATAVRTAAVFVARLLTPTAAFASFYDSAAQGRSQVDQLTQQQLDGLNGKVFSDAFITAKIIGCNPTEIDQLKSGVQQLRQENTQLRSKLDGLQGALGLVVNMQAMLLVKL
jgi:hypothetical protein